MSDTLVFEQHLGRVRRLAFLRTLNRIVLVAAFIFLSGYTALAITQRLGKLPFDVTPYIYGGLAAGAWVVAIGYVLLTRTRLLAMLIEIDARLKLRDRLSTAYEYQTRGKPSEFLDLLTADAGQRLSRLRSQQLFPFRWSWLHLLILIVVLLNAGLLGLDAMLPKKEVPAPLNPQVSEQIRKTITDYLKQAETKPQEPEAKKKTQAELQQQLEDMARQLEQQQMTRKQVLDTVQENLREIQSQQDQLTEELTTELKKLDNIRDLPMPNMSQLQELSSQQLSKMQKMFSEALGGELPQNIQEDMETLSQYQDMQALLENMEDRLTNPGQRDDGQMNAQQQQQQDGKGSGTGEPTMSEQQQSQYAEAPSDARGSEESRSMKQDIGGEPMDGIGGEDPESQSDSPAPGHSPGDGQLNVPTRIEQAATSPQQDSVAPSRKAEFNAQIRSVTTIGEATVPEAEVGRTYQREVEHVLQKEDLPLNYREYIKTYFLSIGLTESD